MKTPWEKEYLLLKSQCMQEELLAKRRSEKIIISTKADPKFKTEGDAQMASDISSMEYEKKRLIDRLGNLPEEERIVQLNKEIKRIKKSGREVPQQLITETTHCMQMLQDEQVLAHAISKQTNGEHLKRSHIRSALEAASRLAKTAAAHDTEAELQAKFPEYDFSIPLPGAENDHSCLTTALESLKSGRPLSKKDFNAAKRLAEIAGRDGTESELQSRYPGIDFAYLMAN